MLCDTIPIANAALVRGLAAVTDRYVPMLRSDAHFNLWSSVLPTEYQSDIFEGTEATLPEVRYHLSCTPSEFKLTAYLAHSRLIRSSQTNRNIGASK